MWTKRILIILPIVVVAFLLQSFFWVPNYEKQAKHPERLLKYITSSGADANILNPILSSDTASSQISDMIFEGLIDRDKDLNFRGRVAEGWEITEEAYLMISQGKEAEALVKAIEDAKAIRAEEKSPVADSLRNITKIEIVPPMENSQRFYVEIKEPAKMMEYWVKAALPARIKFTMKNVDQDLGKALEEIVGKEPFAIDTTSLLTLAPPTEEKVTDAEQAEAVKSFEKQKKDLAEAIAAPMEHNPVIVFHIRKGIKFHDGEPLTSADVKFTYDSLVDPKTQSPRISDYEPVKYVETPDEWTVRIIYRRLYSPAFGSWGMGILPEHLLNKEKLAEEAKARGIDPKNFTMMESKFSRAPIGSGPYIFVDWKSDESITLVRNENYWEGAPEYKEYLFRIIPDQLSQELEFYAGAVDGYGPMPIQVERMKKDERFQNFDTVSYAYDYIGYNMRRDKFMDKRVRTALSMALDVDAIIKYIYYGQAERTTGPFPKPIPAYNHEVKAPPYDPEGALKLFAEAGWKRDTDGWLKNDKGEKFSFHLLTNNGNPIRRDITAIAQESWRRIGVDVTIQQVEWTKFLKQVNTHDFDACVLGWSMGVDPDLYQLWHSSQSAPEMLNFCGFVNKEADDLIIRIRQEYNEQKQIELCHRLHQVIADEQPYTFLTVRKSTYLLDRRIFSVRRDEKGEVNKTEKIKASKTGNFFYDFNHWLKLSKAPEIAAE